MALFLPCAVTRSAIMSGDLVKDEANETKVDYLRTSVSMPFNWLGSLQLLHISDKENFCLCFLSLIKQTTKQANILK